jgi:hypothetical protein
VVPAQASTIQTSPVSGDEVTIMEAVQSVLRDYPLICVAQEELNVC